MQQPATHAPSPAFVGASWGALTIGMLTYLIGLWNAGMMLSEKGFYLILLAYGLFAAISLQKTVRDRLDGAHVTTLYSAMCWASLVLALSLLAIGLWHAALAASEKGFYAMGYVLSLFAAVAVQKNVRDGAVVAADYRRQPGHITAD